MLKSELIRPRIQIRNGQVTPRLLEANYHWLDVSGALIELFKSQQNQSRGTLENVLKEFEGDSLEYQIIRGLTAVLTSRATFDNHPPISPVELREKLFAQGPAGSHSNLLHPKTRTQIIKEIAGEYKLTPTQIESAFFADLAEEQILQEVGEPITPRELIDRYNLEVARGLLYWAKEMHIHVEDGYREVFRFIKLFGLMHTIFPSTNGYDITLHGPISPFVSSTIRYGIQFAKFLPALLLCDTWHMKASIRPPGENKFLHYAMNDQTTLRSHFKSSAGFASLLESNFAAEFESKYNRANRVWELGYEDEIIPLGETVMIPDFSFTHRKNGRRALLEIVGFWHPNYLQRKLKKVQQANRSDLILLVYENAKVSEGAFEAASAGDVLTFKSKPVLKDVISAIENCAI